MDKIDFSQFVLPRYQEIPNVGLYLKQVVTYVNESLEPILQTHVTTTMLSNYVKLHLVPNPEKKMYRRDHIARFVFIVLAKNVISLDNIKNLFSRQEDMASTEEAYNFFCQQFEDVLRLVSGGNIEIAASKGEAVEIYLLRQTVITLAHKIYMDECYRLSIEKMEE